MRRILLILFPLINFSPICAQNTEGSLHSREVIVHKGDTIIRVTLLTGKLKHRLSEERVYFYYSKGTISSNMGDYGGNLLNGEYKAFLNNKLIESGQFSLGCKSGVWKSWYLNGKFKKISYWKNGKPESKFKYFDENGIIKQQEYSKHGKFNSKRVIVEKDSTGKVPVKRRIKNDAGPKKGNSSKKSVKK